MRRGIRACAAALGLVWASTAADFRQDVQTIIAKSVAANNADWKAAPEFDFTEKDKTRSGTKTYQVMMILGSPYYRLVAVNGRPLASSAEEAQQKSLEKVIAQRQAESPQERSERKAKYERDRARDRILLSQLTVAFDFTLQQEERLGPYKVYVLSATPHPGYRPPNMECQALTGMEGTLWIDTATFQWVKVQAHVFRPVSIEGFLAEVEPGTQFELDQTPVGNDVWLPSRFVMKSRAKVLHIFNHRTQDNETYTRYRKAGLWNGAAVTAIH